MASITKPIAFTLLVGVLVVAWNVGTDHDAVIAQRRKPIVVTRIFTGPDGQTHAENIEPKLTASGGSGELSEMVKVTGLQFRRQSPNYFQEGEVELVGGKKIPLDPGHILLAEDLTGRGHISRGVGTEDRISLFIPLAEQ
ncbi:MAG: hypothetical protein DMF89_08125 [Acidobacteria bacterium]|nr:MAG: hypothetical protein DMF89_08125 [Acidobacteriota bacterium]